jgi:hypothetical protein
MVIDNVKPFGEFESGFENGKGYYNVNEKQVQVSKLSDDIDEEATTVNVDGSNVDFTYAPDTKTISFTLNKSNAYGHPWSGHKIRATLVDTAGNEYSLAEVSNIYIGNWFLRFWIIFIVGAAVVIGAGACIMLMRRRKVVD